MSFYLSTNSYFQRILRSHQYMFNVHFNLSNFGFLFSCAMVLFYIQQNVQLQTVLGHFIPPSLLCSSHCLIFVLLHSYHFTCKKRKKSCLRDSFDSSFHLSIFLIILPDQIKRERARLQFLVLENMWGFWYWLQPGIVLGRRSASSPTALLCKLPCWSVCYSFNVCEKIWGRLNYALPFWM